MDPPCFELDARSDVSFPEGQGPGGPSGKLVVELDGCFHDHPATAERDAIRTAWLQARGYRVIRFPNGAVWGALGEVLAAILKAARPPSLTLPLEGGGETRAPSSPPGRRAATPEARGLSPRAGGAS